MLTVHDRALTIREACAANPGGGGMDARFTNPQTIRDCRLTADARPVIRVKGPVRLSGAPGNIGRTDRKLSKRERIARARANRKGR